jgi:hypothetical protein
MAAADGIVDLGKFVPGCGQADLKSLGFAAPAFALGFSDTGDEVVVDVDEALVLGGVDAE